MTPLSQSPLASARLLVESQSDGEGQLKAQVQLPDSFGKLLFKLAAQVCRRYHLPDQERDEVIQETYSQILDPSIVRFHPERGNPRQYFQGQVQNAAQKVAASLNKHQTWANPDRAGTIPERCPTSPHTELERRDTVDWVMRSATPLVRRALQLLHWEGWPLKTVARHLGISRFALSRKINNFYAQMRFVFDPTSAIN